MNNCQTQSHTRGAALLMFVVFFMFASIAVASLVTRNVLSAVTLYALAFESRQSYLSSEALAEDVAYRNIVGMNVDAVETNELFGVTVGATTTLDTVNDRSVISTLGVLDNTYRTTEILLSIGTGVSFNFGLQTGNGGIDMDNNSSVQGNVFSNGVIIGSNSATVYGDVISAGPAGYVGGFHATGSVWAHDIENMDIDGDAYYVSDNSSVVNGTRYTPEPDQATASMPIADSVIEEWQTNIETGGTIITSTSTECSSGTYRIDSDTSIGDVKIDCNLEVAQNGTDLTLTGPVWVVGNITFDQGPNITIDPTVGARSVQIIADDPGSRATSSQIQVNNSTDFSGTGNPKSYVMLVSMNNDAENSGANYAIDLNQSANGDVLIYAPHGRVSMGNNISLKEVTAYQIDISNGSEVIYESGLVNLLFTSGPGGGFTFEGWGENES